PLHCQSIATTDNLKPLPIPFLQNSLSLPKSSSTRYYSLEENNIKKPLLTLLPVTIDNLK
ncbi:hypothetical protein AB4505_26035, partial [Vibrio splendidus]